MALWSPMKTVFYKECWDVLGFGVLVVFPREAGLHVVMKLRSPIAEI